ncbi:hypothetical protein BV898_01417 [Hypsibius exemplaris]|uniref:Gustatory receptor n=1 Tax=Hypsibius exemplaris TaxID=2072580 RepID=A0A1W0XBD8_HYPEX|nr:hypothetical protein BV898_01417 [Hypsibius exemplaris]
MNSVFPGKMLAAFGFLPFSTKNPILRLLSGLVCTFYMVGATAGFVVLSIIVVSDMLNTATARQGNSFLQLLSWIPVSGVYIRAFIIMIMLLAKRKTLYFLCDETLRMVNRLIPHREDLQTHQVRWQRMANLLGIATVLGHIVWYLTDYIGLVLPSSSVDNNKHAETHVNETTQQLLVPLKVIWAASSFYVSLFCLSQQVIVMNVVFAAILRSLIRKHNAVLMAMLDGLEGGHRETDKKVDEFRVPDATVRLILIEQLATARYNQTELSKFSAQINSVFHNIVFCAHVLDQMCLIGFVAAAIVTGPSVNLANWIHNSLSIVFFVYYSTLLLLPLARVFDEVKLNNSVYVESAERHTTNPKSNAYRHDHLI